MKNLMATLCVLFIGNTVMAQHSYPTLSGTPPQKNNHGGTVSIAAHQPYPGTNKGAFISRIARLKEKKINFRKTGSVSKLKESKAPNVSTKTKDLRVKSVQRQGQSSRPILVKNAGSKNRPGQVNRPIPTRRQPNHGRFTHLGRG